MHTCLGVDPIEQSGACTWVNMKKIVQQLCEAGPILWVY